jgi:SAM-dependent methyltransferase
MPTTWSEAAALRREQIESGRDLTFHKVFLPYFRQVRDALRPARILDVGCGTGHIALALRSEDATIAAVEPLPSMFAVACDVLRDSGITARNQRLEEVTDPPFDLVLANMVAHMVEDLGGFFAAMRRALLPDGRSVVCIPHPCFWNNYRRYIPPDEYNYMKREYVEATVRITKDPERPVTGVPYYHRPLQDYVKALATAGLCLLDMDELYPEPAVQAEYDCPWHEPRFVVFTCARRE